MLNPKSKVIAQQINSIRKMKVFGRNGAKRGGHKCGEIVNVSVKNGDYANSISRKGTKHKGLIASTRSRTKSKYLRGSFDIVYTNNTVILLDRTKLSLLTPITSSNIKYPLLMDAQLTLAQIASKNKSKDVPTYQML